MAGSIKELIRQCASVEMPGLEIGVVMETEPLRITLEDDAKINLSAVSLVVPSGKLPLKVNERLYLLSLNGGKLYYVLDRV